jgi:hypothetical protein
MAGMIAWIVSLSRCDTATAPSTEYAVEGCLCATRRLYDADQCYKEVMAWLFLIVSLIAATACSSPSAPSGPIDEQVTLAPGQTAPVAGASIQLRFVGVSGDSRCPADALCIQGGDAIVQLELLRPNGEVNRLELHTGRSEPARHGMFTISLVELSPYPFSSRPIAPGDYRARVRVVRS